MRAQFDTHEVACHEISSSARRGAASPIATIRVRLSSAAEKRQAARSKALYDPHRRRQRAVACPSGALSRRGRSANDDVPSERMRSVLEAPHVAGCYRPGDTKLRRSTNMAAGTSMGYCMKCKAQREIKGPKQITMKNGRPATEGTCSVCDTKMFKIGAAK
jgi:hypothetical protein